MYIDEVNVVFDTPPTSGFEFESIMYMQPVFEADGVEGS
jgi:hypothetical protein